MKYFFIWLLLLLFPLSCIGEQNAYLSSDELRALQPSYEIFLDSLSALLVEKGLLEEAQREEWILYQKGDFLQNGGYGSISIFYTPGLLSMADDSIPVRVFSAETDAGTLTLETLRRYVPAHSPLPGLPLDHVELVDADGNPVDCRYRWIVPYGSLFLWDGRNHEMVEVGASYINDGKPLFWSAEPVDGIEETIYLELLSATEDHALSSVTLTVISEADAWRPEGVE